MLYKNKNSNTISNFGTSTVTALRTDHYGTISERELTFGVILILLTCASSLEERSVSRLHGHQGLTNSLEFSRDFLRVNVPQKTLPCCWNTQVARITINKQEKTNRQTKRTLLLCLLRVGVLILVWHKGRVREPCHNELQA